MGSDFRDIFGDWDPRRDGERPGEPENGEPVSVEFVDATVLGVYGEADSPGDAPTQMCVLLQDAVGRKLPIFIGAFEAIAISTSQSREQFTRPMTHDLLRLVILRLGGVLERVLIDDLWNDTYYAKLVIELEGGPTNVDCRPSDGIALALRFGAPIQVAEHVMQAGAREI